MVSTSHVERASVFTRQAETLAEYYDVAFVFPFRPTERLAPKRDYKRFLIRLRTPRLPILRLFALLEFVIGLWRAALGFRPEVVHAHNLHAAILSWPLARLLRAKLVYDAHELAPGLFIYARRPFRRSIAKMVDGFLSRRCDLVIAAIESRADYMTREYRLGRTPVVVHNAPPYRKPVQSARARDFLASTGQPNATIVLYQGVLSVGRNIEELVRSAAHFGEGICLVLLGYGQVAAVERIIRQEGLEQRVFVHEPVYGDAYHEFTCSVDMGVVMYADVCLNHHFCAPSKIYEYAMAGIPMVGNDLPTLRDCFERHGVGVIAPSTKPEDLGAAITEALSDRNRYLQMKINCAKFAEEYTWEKESAKLLAAYRNLLFE